jgi:hypothetical protein
MLKRHEIISIEELRFMTVFRVNHRNQEVERNRICLLRKYAFDEATINRR